MTVSPGRSLLGLHRARRIVILAASAAARTSRQTERGGILVGHRTPGGVYVEDTLAVSDPNAGHSHYVRRSKAARAILRDYVGVAEGCSTTGYVGEWHTHPRPEPPSRIDHATMRFMVLKNPSTVAMIVAALGADGRTVELHGLLGDAASLHRRIQGRHDKVQVVYRNRP